MLLLAAWLLMLAGCGKPPMLVHQYILEYPAPVLSGRAKSPEAVKIGLFSVAQAYNTKHMVYQPQPFKSETYNYSRWRTNPGYLVTDYLLRDFRDSHLFTAVFGPGSVGKYRFSLQGGVDEFQELDEPDGWQAALGLTITLLDVSKQELPQRIVFQKNYRVVEPMLSKTPQGLAQAMSQAMRHLSERIILDTYNAIQRRTARK
ncbi:MAG: ABC-type transport auxiliary lipoprotein family protein [Deltaproteobacteria bacterium]